MNEEQELTPEQAAEAEAIHARLKRTAEDIITIGLDLLEVKDRLGHGQFGQWLQAEFGMSDRHARRFMSVSEKFKNKMDIMSDLPFINICNGESALLKTLRLLIWQKSTATST